MPPADNAYQSKRSAGVFKERDSRHADTPPVKFLTNKAPFMGPIGHMGHIPPAVGQLLAAHPEHPQGVQTVIRLRSGAYGKQEPIASKYG